MTVKCKVEGCGTAYSITKTKVCPKCGATPSGYMPAAAGSAFNVGVKVAEPVRILPGGGELK